MVTTRINNVIDEMSFYIYLSNFRRPYPTKVMESFSRIIVVTFVVFMAISSSNGDLNTTLEDLLCNYETYKANDYTDNVAHVLEEMIIVTTNCPDYSYNT